VRDLLALSISLDGIMIMPKMHCFCDRYWNDLSNCRFPIGPRNMPLPFGCPQDALYDLVRWNTKKVRFREHTFLQNPKVPAELRHNTLRIVVGASDSDQAEGTVAVAAGTPMHDVKSIVMRANPLVRLVEISVEDIKKLCRWLGTPRATADFNKLMRYVLTDSSRYCPMEDHRRHHSNWNWRNPFTAYNCTWGFHYPTPFPEKFPCAGSTGGTVLDERSNSTTCPRQMLCDWNTQTDGRESGKLTYCNIEGYGGMDPAFKPATERMLKMMPGGRCPYPPGDRPGGGPGFDADGHWIGQAT